METLETLLKSILEREAASEGILTARHYVEGFRSCFGNEICAAKFGGIGTSEEWAKCLKDAESKLVYRNEEMTNLHDGMSVESLRKQFPDMEIKSPTKNTAGACLDFTCVLTSTKEDRDRDVLQAKGAQVDPSMPVLAQHVPMLNIGKLVAVLGQNQKRVITQGAIIDSPLGRDYAQLVEFGAVRISHGFRPLKWKPREKQKGDDSQRPPGFDIEEFEVMEKSLVSIPSNTDAVVTAFSRGKLHHPFIKGWAEGLHAGRTKTVVSGWDRSSPVKIEMHFHNPPETKGDKGHKCTACQNGDSKTKDDPKPEKKGGYLSAEHHGNLEKAHGTLDKMYSMDMPIGIKELAGKAKGYVKGALDHLTGPADDQTGTNTSRASASELATKLLGKLMQGEEVSEAILVSVRQASKQAIKRGRNKRLKALLSQ